MSAWNQNLQRALVRNLSVVAEAAGRSDLMPLWAGQSASLSTCEDVTVFLNSLLEKGRKSLDRSLSGAPDAGRNNPHRINAGEVRWRKKPNTIVVSLLALPR